MKKSALTAVKTQVIYLDLGWTEGNFADIVGVPRKKQRLAPLHPLEKNAEFFLCSCEAEPEHPGAELKSCKENSHPNHAPPVSARLCVGRTLPRETLPRMETLMCSISFSCLRMPTWLLKNSLGLGSKVCSCSVPATLLTAHWHVPGRIPINWEHCACPRTVPWHHWLHRGITCF